MRCASWLRRTRYRAAIETIASAWKKGNRDAQMSPVGIGRGFCRAWCRRRATMADERTDPRHHIQHPGQRARRHCAHRVRPGGTSDRADHRRREQAGGGERHRHCGGRESRPRRLHRAGHHLGDRDRALYAQGAALRHAARSARGDAARQSDQRHDRAGRPLQVAQGPGREGEGQNPTPCFTPRSVPAAPAI